MCLTIPARVVSVSGKLADVLENGEERAIDISLLPRLKAGDWILHTVGLAIKKVSPKDAREIIELLESSRKVNNSSLSDKFKRILQASKVRELSREEISYLLQTDNPEEVNALHSEANTIRKAYLKEFICVHGIIEFSNICAKDCYYCGIRSESNVKRYRMSVSEVVSTAAKAAERGYKLLVLQSGEDSLFNDEELEEIVREIKRRSRVFIFLSIGERGYESYKRLRKAGASGVLLRFETSNSQLFKELHPEGKDLDNRFSHLSFLKELGYFIATGFMVGLPGQTIEDMANDILTLKNLNPGMASIGPFIPSPETPLSDKASGSTDMTLRVMAIIRLMMKNVRIPVTTAMETIGGAGMRKEGLMAGGNAMMFNLTPPRYRRLYQIYPDKFYQRDRRWERYALFQGKESYRMLEERLRP
ncbi:MAG: [FeFe] hydrogenase H-cluster radical SAM maturase HydE [Deltaproteobacteria bacterium]|nr:[FeFe] hydrogenase H-cluster radical SAM maturase HydE [Deltaproteobacteria bacterium]